MSPRTTLAYGVVAMLIGLLWVLVSLATILAGYVLAVALIFFGIVFLAYTRIRPKSA
jgi:O-antigen ligase